MAGTGCMELVLGSNKTDENSNKSPARDGEALKKNGVYIGITNHKNSKTPVFVKRTKNVNTCHLNGGAKSNKLSVSRSYKGGFLNRQISPQRNRRSPRFTKRHIEERLSTVVADTDRTFSCTCITMGRTPLLNGTIPSSPTVRRSLTCQCNKASTSNTQDLTVMLSKAVSTIPNHKREDGVLDVCYEDEVMDVCFGDYREECIYMDNPDTKYARNGRTDKEQINNGNVLKTETGKINGKIESGKIFKTENGKNRLLDSFVKNGLLDSCVKNGLTHLGKDFPVNGLIHTQKGVYFHNSRTPTNMRKFPEKIENKMLRFGASTSNNDVNSVIVKEKSQEPITIECKWNKCSLTLDADLLSDHIRSEHVDSQRIKNKFVCLWDKCKVYNKESSSFSWLERHILSHSGAKPFKCIFDGCGLRYTSQSMLERHVNNHFNTYQQSSPKPVRKEDTPNKIKKKKLKGRRSSCRIKFTDIFDSQTVEGVKQQLAELNKLSLIDTKGSGRNITFRSSVIARKTDSLGKLNVLLHWTPEDILEDVWVPEEKVASLRKQTIAMSCLPHQNTTNLTTFVYRQHRYRKQKRK